MIRICVAGPIGYEKAQALFREHQELIRKRFSRNFLLCFEKIREKRIPCFKAELAESADSVLYISEISEGGLFGALWKACTAVSGDRPAGCRVDMEAVPIAQEIIEICELFDENPYEISSCGAYVILLDEDAPEGNDDLLAQATVIGRITGDPKRILVHHDAERYLTPPERQSKDMLDRKSYRRKA